MRWLLPAFSIAASACTFSGGSSPGDGDGDGDTDAGVDAAPIVDCEPDQPVCDGTTLKTCNGTGDGYVDGGQLCPLACVEGACYQASNVPLADQRDCVGLDRLTPPPGATVDLSGSGGQIDCEPHCGDPAVTQISSTSIDVSGSPDLALFCLSALTLPPDVTLSTDAGTDPALVLLVRGDATIDGTIEVDGSDGEFSGGDGGPGGGNGGDLSGGNGDDGDGTCPGLGAVSGDAGAGGGGGGNGGSGGNGGDGSNSGGALGPACGPDALIPLVGGSGGAGGSDGTDGGLIGAPGGGGGGAVQIAVAGELIVSGEIRGNGGDGAPAFDDAGAGGGGSGGSILLEAAVATVSGSLAVDGGDGGDSPAGSGGLGASGSSAIGTSGANSQDSDEGGAGGGGGGGLVRINAVTTDVSCAGVASPSGVCELGDLTPGQ